MQELRLVAVSEDGTYLVLATAGRGTRFTLPVDDRVRAAVRGHFSRLGQFEIEVESPLRPKEIQARIRSGETAEEIAESAGIPVERVRWFEGPVLQEREYMAQQAQRVAVRRPGESTPGPPLGETVEERLGRGGVDLEDIEWDAWKCDNGTWRVRLSFFDNGRPHAAEWAFDPRRRHVSPLDEIAARLTAVDWDDDEMSESDTVTPLVPRRPAMKVVTDGRDASRDIGRDMGRRELGRGLPADPEPPLERASEPPLRAAEPPEYIVDRGRIVDPRPAFPSTVQPGRPREASGNRDPIRPFDDTEPNAPSAGPPWRRAPEPSLEELEATPVPPRAAPAPPAAAAEEEPPEEPQEPDEAELRESDEAEAPEEAAADGTADLEDAEPEAETAAEDDAEADAEEDEEPAAERPEPVEEASTAQSDQDDDTDDDVQPAAEEAVADEAEDKDEDDAPPAAEEAEQAARPEPRDEPAPRERGQAPSEPEPEPEPEPRKQAPREKAPRGKASQEQAPREKAAPAATQRTPHREPARPAPKKQPARPAMPAAAQDNPAGGPPAAAAAAESASAPQRPARARRKPKGKRASVPSWDEIMFGARRPE